MAEVIAQRMAARIEGDFVVFLIGMRINKPWKVHKWFPVAMAMPRMRKELAAKPDLGLLSVRASFGFVVQYWRSYEHLERYARGRDHEHFPAWVAFNKSLANARGDVGIWHETFLVSAGQYEAVYSGVPRAGLALAGDLVPATGSLSSARERLRGEKAPPAPEVDAS